MTVEQTIDYEALAQDAMRGVVRAVMLRVYKHGLPGNHHFYIAFNTQAPGVVISPRLREKYPDEMTIVMQHRFWDLQVNHERFEIKLTFDSIPERLVVPFSAVKVFFDPSVPYGLQFEESELSSDANRQALGLDDDARGASEPVKLRPLPSKARPKARRIADEAETEAGDEVLSVPKKRAPRRTVKPKPVAADAARAGAGDDNGDKPRRAKPERVPVPAAASAAAAEDAATPEAEEAASKVVQLDAFRKK